MHSELHELVTLALLIVCGYIVFLFAVGDAYHICWCVDSALALALIAEWIGVWVYRIDGRITCLTKSGVGAVGAVDGVEEGIEKAAAVLEACGVEEIVGLKEN